MRKYIYFFCAIMLSAGVSAQVSSGGVSDEDYRPFVEEGKEWVVCGMGDMTNPAAVLTGCVFTKSPATPLSPENNVRLVAEPGCQIIIKNGGSLQCNKNYPFDIQEGVVLQIENGVIV